MTGSSAPSVGWGLVLPDETHTYLLQACLLNGDSAQHAWNAFIARVGDARRFFEDDHAGLKSFLPFAEFSLNANKIDADPAFRTYARVALLREELRCEIYCRVLNEVVDALTSSGLNYCLIRGAALSPWLYPSTHIRHNHAIDIVVDSADTHAVALALQRIGLSTGANRPQATQVTFLHHSELPIIVHTQLLHLPEMGYMGTFAGKSTTRQLADRSFSTLDTTSHCLQVLGNASCSTQNGNLRWVIDAFHLMTNADEIDWPEFWRIARQLGIDGFCTAALRYLANDLRIQLPDQANAEWHASGGVGGRGDRRRFFAALHCTRGSHTRVLRAMRNAPLLAMAYLQFAIFPSADYLAFRYGVVDSAQRVAWHADRPRRAIRYFLRRQTNA